MHPSRLTRDPDKRFFPASPAILRHARRSEHRQSDQASDASLTVAWTVPINTGSSAITAYDLRYIDNGAAGKSDANRTVLEGVRTTGPGSLQYTLTGLADGTHYGVQMRAVNSGGDGTWSVTGTTASAGPSWLTGTTATVTT